MKALVNPLFWFCISQLVLLGFLCIPNWKELTPVGRIISALLFLSVVGLAVLSLPVTADILERSLTLAMNENDTISSQQPDYIFVLGAGYNVGSNVQEDFLSDICYKRVFTGASLWRQHQSAKLVVSGASLGYPQRSTNRMAQLMNEASVLSGVEQAQIIMEPNSINTREHPLEALKLPGVTSQTPIIVVTSAWHLRRAKQEFSKHFSNVAFFPVPSVINILSWQSFLPNAGALAESTMYLREWIGMAWYAVVDIGT